MRAEHRTLWRVMMLVALSGGLLPAVLWGEEASQDLPSPQAFTLTVQAQRLSLQAHEASLKAILAQIGRELGIDVVVHLPADETITVTFDRLPVVEALKQLSPNYAYVVDTARGDRSITKIIVLSPGESTTRPLLPALHQRRTHEMVRPQPFKFEFDPSKAMQEGK